MVVALVIGAISLPAAAADYWVTGLVAPAGVRQFVAVDVDTAADADGIRTVWIYAIEGINGQLTTVRGIHMSYRCMAHELAEGRYLEYDVESLSVVRDSIVTTLYFVAAEQSGLGTLRFVCEGVTERFKPMPNAPKLCALVRGLAELIAGRAKTPDEIRGLEQSC